MLYANELIFMMIKVYEESIIDGLCSILYDLLQEDPEHSIFSLHSKISNRKEGISCMHIKK